MIDLTAGAAQKMFSETFVDQAMGRGAGVSGALGSRVCSLGQRAAAEVRAQCGLWPQASWTGLPLCDGLNSLLANSRDSLKLVGALTTVGRLKHWKTHLSQGGGTQDSPSRLSPWEPPPRPPKPLVLHWRGCMPSAGP